VFKLTFFLTVSLLINPLFARDKAQINQAALDLFESSQVIESINVSDICANIKYSKLTPAEIAVNKQSIEDTVIKSIEKMKNINWSKKFARAYNENFTIDEINQLITYYSNPQSNTAPPHLNKFVELNQSMIDKHINRYISQITASLENIFIEESLAQ